MPASTSGYPVIPSFQAASELGIVEPAVASRPQVLDLRPRLREEELGVEITPAQLPHERIAAPLVRAHGERTR